MTKIQLKKVQSLCTQIEAKKNELAKTRDAIRELYHDLESLLEDLDTGVQDIESGLQSIQFGVDAISQQI